MVERSAEGLAEGAEGNIGPDELTETESGGLLSTSVLLYDGPIIDYLEADEEPQYLLTNEKQGFRLYPPDTDEKTPHHQLRGKKYLLLTNRRILYVAGCSDGDEVIEFDYADITEAEFDPEIGIGESLYITVQDGTKYKFTNKSNPAVKSASEYITAQISPRPDENEADDSPDESASLGSKDGGFKFTAHVKSHNLPPTSEPGATPTDLSEQFSPTDAHEVTVDDSGLQIYGGEYRIGFDGIAEVQEFEDRYVASGSEGTFETKGVGVKMTISNGGELRIYESYSGAPPAPEIALPKEITQHIQKRVNESSKIEPQYRYSLCDRLEINRPDLKVEGWTDGSSNISADVDASASSKGKSRGIELGPFTRSQTSSSSSIEGEISGDISDNTYTTTVDSFRLYDDYLSINSDLALELQYSDIDDVFKQDGGGMTKQGDTLVKQGDGVVIQAGPATFRIENLSEGAPIEEGIEFIKSKLDNRDDLTRSSDPGNESDADKLREVRDLYDDGVITEEEFESKKQELLDNL